jgi:glycosyltransferase involved in cell wall biosynthesis
VIEPVVMTNRPRSADSPCRTGRRCSVRLPRPASPTYASRVKGAAREHLQRTPLRRDRSASDGRVRVLLVIKSLGIGGAERLLLSTVRTRDRANFDYEVAYVVNVEPNLAGDLEASGVPVHRIGGHSHFDPAWLWRFRRLLRRGDFDIVHFHSPYVAGLGRLAARTVSPRPRSVSTQHCVWRAIPTPVRWLSWLTAPLDRASLVVSEAAQATLPRRAGRGSEVVVHGVDMNEIEQLRGARAPMRARLGVGPDQVLVVTVANYRPEKGYNDLLAAARQTLDRGLPVKFATVGYGPLAGEVTALHEHLRLGDDVLLLGLRDDALAVIAAADVFVLASHHEGFPVAVMEALALGVPVVATSVGGLPNAVESGVEGLLVPPRRPDLLSAAIGQLVIDPEVRARMALAARRRGAGYDILRAVRRIEDLYRSIITA